MIRQSPLVTHIAYALHITSLKLRTLVTEVLAHICVLPARDGYRAVIAALSDYRIAYDENFRFETLLAPLRLPDNDELTVDGLGFGTEEDGIWDARTASMALINALTSVPDSLEDRIILREEFGRRGLNEMIVVSCPTHSHGIKY